MTTISVRTKRTTTDPITIKRGVKQGWCPHSHILFNLVMEVLIRAAEGVSGAGYKVTNSIIKSLAYADDLYTSPLMQEMLDRIHLASTWAGLSFLPRKLSTLLIVRAHRARQHVANEKVMLGGTVQIPGSEDRSRSLS